MSNKPRKLFDDDDEDEDYQPTDTAASSQPVTQADTA